MFTDELIFKIKSCTEGLQYTLHFCRYISIYPIDIYQYIIIFNRQYREQKMANVVSTNVQLLEYKI